MRGTIKRGLARLPRGGGLGTTLLIYHRVGGGSPDELDVSVADFEAQLEVLASHHVVGLDDAADAVEAGDAAPRVVLTFDDGFRDVYDHAWPRLREHAVPFTVYLTTAYVGGSMRWAGSTAAEQGAPGLTWANLEEMVASGLCTVGNHTHTHVRPERLDVDELDRCSDAVEERLGLRPRHFTYTWGIPVPALEPELRARFRTASTGRLGQVLPGVDPMRWPRVPVRRTDPVAFFEAKLDRRLTAERAYARIVSTAKRLGVRA